MTVHVTEVPNENIPLQAIHNYDYGAVASKHMEGLVMKWMHVSYCGDINTCSFNRQQYIDRPGCRRLSLVVCFIHSCKSDVRRQCSVSICAPCLDH